MADFNIAINLKANDGGTAQIISGIRGNLKGLEGDLGRASQPGGGLAKLGAGFTTAGSAVNQMTQSARGILDPIISEGVLFERSMAEVLAFGGTKFAPFMEDLHDQARQLGADTEFTAVQAAASMRQLAQAGLEPAEVMSTLPEIMNLAKAGALDLAPAAKIVSSAMAQFAGSGESAIDVTNILARTANSTQTHVAAIGSALQQTGSSADLLGFSLKETSVLIAGLGKTAISGGRAGTLLDAVFLGLSRLTNPALKKGLKQLGVTQKDLVKNLANQDIGAIIRQFDAGFEAKGLGGVENAARRMEILTKIFNKRGARGFLALSKAEGLGKLDELTAGMEDVTDAAKDMGDIMSDTTQGDLKRMDSSLSELKLTVADELLPALRPLLKDVTALVKTFADWAKKNPDAVRSLAMLAVKVVALGTVLGPLLTVTGSFITLMSVASKLSGGALSIGLRKAGVSAAATSRAVGLLGAAGAGLGIALAGSAIIVGVYRNELAKLHAVSRAFANDVISNEAAVAEGLSDEQLAEREQTIGQQAAAMRAETTAKQDDESGFVNFVTGGSAVDTSAADALEGQHRALRDERLRRVKLADEAVRFEKRTAEAAKAAGIQEAKPAGAGDGSAELLRILSESGLNKAEIKIVVDEQRRLVSVGGKDVTGMSEGTSLEGL